MSKYHLAAALCHDLCSDFEIPLWNPDIRFWGWEVLGWEQAASTSAWPCWGPSSSSPPSPSTGSSPPPTSDWWVQCARKQNIAEIINCNSRQVLDPSAWWKGAWRWRACIFRSDSISSTSLKSLTQSQSYTFRFSLNPSAGVIFLCRHNLWLKFSLHQSTQIATKQITNM